MSDAPKRFRPGAIDYAGPIAANYRAGRELSRDAMETWRVTIEPFIPRTGRARVLDLGAGTGRFVPLLASFTPARLIAVEPSLHMLQVAVRQHVDVTVHYAAGGAEAIPLCDGSCDVAWLSYVYHHVRDRALCVTELGRVIRPGGRVLLRGTFADRLDGYPTLFRFFPGARRICEDLPTVAETRVRFAAESFTPEAHLRVEQITCGSLREFAERTSKRADTALTLITDDEFEAGLEAVREAAAVETEPAPIVETVDLLVFQRQTLNAW